MSRDRITDLLAEPPPEPRRNRLSDLMDAEGWLPQPPQRGPQTALLAGPNAQTADLSALSAAMTMTDTGTSPEDVWRQTGWWRNPAGNWRFEIDDSQATLGDVKGGTAGAALSHQQVYEAYPDLANVPLLDINKNDRGFIRGSYVSPGQWLPSLRRLSSEILSLDRQRPEEEKRSSLLHELQHAIDNREGDLSEIAIQSGDFYYPNINEVDARMVQARRDFTPEQRRAALPSTNYDVPPTEVIHNRLSAFLAAERRPQNNVEFWRRLVDHTEFSVGVDMRALEIADNPQERKKIAQRLQATLADLSENRQELKRAEQALRAAHDTVFDSFREIDSIFPFDQEGSH